MKLPNPTSKSTLSADHSTANFITHKFRHALSVAIGDGTRKKCAHKMRCVAIAATLLFAAIVPLRAATQDNTQITKYERIAWDDGLQLPPLPSDSVAHLGLAGAFAGYSGELLIVAGGANFPDGLPSQGGQKHWWGDIYTYSPTDGWQRFDNALPYPVAYGVSIEIPEGVLCIGGCDAKRCFSKVFIISIEHGKPIIKNYPPLPVGLANAAGAMVDGKIYVAGGTESMTPQKATRNFFRLDPAALSKGWQPMEAWDGEARSYAVAVAQSNGMDNCLYLFSGRDLEGDGPWNVLSDGWEFNPSTAKWRRIEGSFPVMAASAVASGTNHIIIFGGRDSANGADNRIRLYHTVTGTMHEVEVDSVTLPVTTTALKHDNHITLASGETAPGVRTPVILSGTLTRKANNFSWLDIAVMVLYFVSLAWIGWYFSKRQQSTDDYFKGGGRIPWIIVGLSILGTTLSAITFMVIPAKAYATDWSYLLFNGGILLVVPIIVLLFIPFYRRFNVTTAYEYLEMRFSPLVRVICSVAFIIFQIGRMGVVLLLPSIALNIVIGFDIFLCIGLMGVLSLLYTLMGGIEAVAWTEALQVVVLLGAAVTVVCVVCSNLPGGMETIIATASESGKMSLGETGFDLRQPTVWTVLIATLFANITTYGTDQTIVQRYQTTQTEKQARKGVYTNALLTVPVSLLFFFVGTALWVFFKQNPVELSATVTDSDAILPWYVSTQLPSGVLGLVIAGIFAAMSTLSSSMNSAATAYITDIHAKFSHRDKVGMLRMARWATLALGIVGIGFALMMATWDIKSLWDEFSKLLGIILGGLGGLFLLGLTTRRANATGAVSGIVGSIVVQSIVTHYHSVYLLLYSSVGFISCYIIGYVVSILTGSNRKGLDNLTIFTRKR